MRRKVIHTTDDVPRHFDNSDEEAKFWETHELSEEFIRSHRLPAGQAPYPAFEELRRRRAEQEAAQKQASASTTSKRQ